MQLKLRQIKDKKPWQCNTNYHEIFINSVRNLSPYNAISSFFTVLATTDEIDETYRKLYANNCNDGSVNNYSISLTIIITELSCWLSDSDITTLRIKNNRGKSSSQLSGHRGCVANYYRQRAYKRKSAD
jgi:hypothetical protein